MNATSGAGRWAAALSKGVAAAAVLTSAIVVLVTCNRDDPLAPEGSTIKVTANPQTILVLNSTASVAQITATLRGKNGSRLPDQEVTFSTTEGSLDPIAETPLTTDNQGQATSKLLTSKQATVTATSGSITGSTTVSTVSGNITGITLDPDTNNLGACDEVVTLTATAEDPNGDGVSGISIRFVAKTISGFNELRGSFSPAQLRTDANGVAISVYNVDDNYCNQKCSSSVGDPNSTPWDCKIQLTAEDSSGSFVSNQVVIDENVP